ncbi:NAD(P)H-dependent oxidoreductase [Nocardioides dubius]|uniref:NADPH-dependent FMN reductase-like domain-containing protein n=1 Tax=Nocardioides dubius TaxID=317019 RepID=A0ABP4E3V6_9ACTN
MRIGVVIGSGNGMDGATGTLVQSLLDEVATRTEIEVAVVHTDDLDLGPSCPGCLNCMTAGEDACPRAAAAAGATALMDAADLMVFATPVHSFHVSASMKRFVDHYAYLIHRPRHHGRPAILISTAAGAGHDAALGYLGEAIRRWGFHTVGRLGVNGPGLAKPGYRSKVDDALRSLAADAVDAVASGAEPTPTTKDLIGFRVARLLVQSSREDGPVDEQYWRERGWFEADWFTDVRVPALPNRLAALVEGRIRRAIEQGTAKPYRG